MKIIKSEEQKQKRLKKSEQSLKDLLDTNKKMYIHCGSPKKREIGTENIWKNNDWKLPKSDENFKYRDPGS